MSGACFNRLIIYDRHLMPFEGVCLSGMGSYYGTFSFGAFSHHRPLMDKQTLFKHTIEYTPYKKS